VEDRSERIQLRSQAPKEIMVQKLSAEHLNDWDVQSWTSQLKSLKGCTAIDGVLFNHPDDAKVYFVSEASAAFGVRFELDRADVVDVMARPDPIVVLGRSLKSVRILVKLDAVVTRIGLHVVGDLVERGDHVAAPQGEKGPTDDVLRLKTTILAVSQMR
jgi:hypothetical protein